VQADRAIAEDREVKDVAVRGVFYDHLGPDTAAVKSVLGMGCSSTRPLAGVQEPQGLLNIERTIYDLVNAPVRFALGFLISHSEHLRLPDHDGPTPNVRRTASNN
jgi:hypothetical protein